MPGANGILPGYNQDKFMGAKAGAALAAYITDIYVCMIQTADQLSR
jgi:hypothetical protein